MRFRVQKLICDQRPAIMRAQGADRRLGDAEFVAAVEASDGSPAAEYYLARPTQYPRED